MMERLIIRLIRWIYSVWPAHGYHDDVRARRQIAEEMEQWSRRRAAMTEAERRAEDDHEKWTYGR